MAHTKAYLFSDNIEEYISYDKNMWIYDAGYHTQYSRLCYSEKQVVNTFKFEDLQKSITEIGNHLQISLNLAHKNKSKLNLISKQNLPLEVKKFFC